MHKWARVYVKNKSCKVSKQLKPIQLFITGSAGVTSRLMKAIYLSVRKTLMYSGGNPDKPHILLLVPTGIPTVNNDGNTIHPGLGINCNTFFSTEWSAKTFPKTQIVRS